MPAAGAAAASFCYIYPDQNQHDHDHTGTSIDTSTVTSQNQNVDIFATICPLPAILIQLRSKRHAGKLQDRSPRPAGPRKHRIFAYHCSMLDMTKFFRA